MGSTIAEFHPAISPEIIPVRFAPVKFTSVRSRPFKFTPLKSAFVKLTPGPRIYPFIHEYPVGSDAGVPVIPPD